MAPAPEPAEKKCKCKDAENEGKGCDEENPDNERTSENQDGSCSFIMSATYIQEETENFEAWDICRIY
ncbi:Histamine H1, putative [Babesia ovata]|uniref:Histamine H1, putative n=1 Tax=Babesia ovata TaxID=189622 RepID=A0A2H6K8U4_9APIC|nr:Histamine H1, putative [Babesia ovata]GBE59398.1 Histamine H1, putative [Babesia ovata]